MQPGKLRHQVELQTATEARDSYGGRVQTWTTAATVWAELDPWHTRDRVSLRRRNGEAAVGVRCWAPQAAAVLGNRMVVRGVAYVITEVDVTREHHGELLIIGRADA